jgi:hypothetical protein
MKKPSINRKKKRMKRFIQLFIILLSIFLSNSLKAQELKENDIRDASNFYDEGRFDEAIFLLRASVISKADKTLQERAYKILASSLYQIDELEQADSFLILFLKIEPLYQPNTTSDPGVFINALRRFKISPKLNFDVKVGLNTTSAEVIQQYILADNVDYGQPYSSNPGFNGSLELERFLFYNFYLKSGINLQSMGYTRTLLYGDSAARNFKLKDQMLRIEVPISLVYKQTLKNFSLSFSAGIGALGNRSVLTATYNALDQNNYSEVVYTKNNRLNYNLRSIYSARVGYLNGNLEYFADFTINQDLLPAVAYHYTQDLYYPMLYVDDNFYLNNNQFSMGVSIRLNYKVTKRYE